VHTHKTHPGAHFHGKSGYSTLIKHSFSVFVAHGGRGVVHMFYPQDVDDGSHLLAAGALGTRRKYMKVHKMLLIVGLVVAASVSGSGTTRVPGETFGTAYGPDVINLDGLQNIEFGDTEQELTQRGVLDTQDSPCSPSLTGMSTVNPTFDHDRLVLLWADPPVHTPEGVTIGTPVNQVRATYPALTRLTAPRGTYRYDGLLARDGDRAYLFLHDGLTVRKTIAGYADYAQRAFDEGFGTC
jgi:hypothetical protein